MKVGAEIPVDETKRHRQPTILFFDAVRPFKDTPERITRNCQVPTLVVIGEGVPEDVACIMDIRIISMEG